MSERIGAAPESAHRQVVPPSMGDSTITSLFKIVKEIPEEDLQDHIEEQVLLLEDANLNLERAATYYASLLHDRESFARLGADYSTPSPTDYLRLRLLALYHLGIRNR